MFSMFISLFVSFFFLLFNASAIAAPTAPKGASADLRSALRGLECSPARKGDWKVDGKGGAALERLTMEEDDLFHTLAEQWAKDHCSTRKSVSGGTTGGKRSDMRLAGSLVMPFGALLMLFRLMRRATMRMLQPYRGLLMRMVRSV